MSNNKILSMLSKTVILVIFIIIGSCYLYSSADERFQSDSENLAIGPIYAKIMDMDIDTEGYGLGNLVSTKCPDNYVYDLVDKEKECYERGYEFFSYNSQVGLHGIMYQFVASILGEFMDFKLICEGLKFCCTFFFAIIAFLIIWQLCKAYGFLFGTIWGLVTFISPWVSNFSNNLYWVEFTWFIPMLLGLFVLNYKRHRLLIYPLFYIFILIKCLCGYEYLSTIMLSGVMFLIIEFILHKEKRCDLLKSIIIIGTLSILAFATAYTIHAFIYGDGNIAQGLELMQVNLVERRTYGDAVDFPSLYTDSLNSSVLFVLWKYLGLGHYNGVFICFLLLSTITTLVYRDKLMKKDCKFEITLFIVTLLSAVSWLVLAKAHSYIHTHINYVLFYMGWVQVCVYIMIKTFSEYKGYVIRKEIQ